MLLERVKSFSIFWLYMKYHLTAPNAFAEDLKVTKPTGMKDAK